MTTTLKNRLAVTEDLQERLRQTSFLHLASYQLIPQLLYDHILDRAIASIECSAEETAAACQQLYQHWGLTSESEQRTWRLDYNLTQTQIEHCATRQLRLEKFKQQTWGHQLETIFLVRKGEFDRVIYSILRVKQPDLARELYFRIHEGEQSFAEVARQYSEGSEAETGGLIGPIELGNLQTRLAERLTTSPTNVVQSLTIGDWTLLVRLEKLLPAQFDAAMRERLLQEQFKAWLQSQIEQLSEVDKRWLGIHPTELPSSTAMN